MLIAPWVLGVAAAFYVLFSGLAQHRLALTAIIFALGCSVAAAALLRFWHGQQPRQLAWDGASWALSGAGSTPADQALTRVEVRLDLQRALLLYGQRAEGRTGCWLWAQASGDPARWHLLRCALYSSSPSSPVAAPASGPDVA